MERRDSRIYAETEETEVGVEGDEGAERIKGLGVVYERWSQDLGGFREIITQGAAADALRTSDIRGLYNHEPNMILGRQKSGTMTLAEESDGVRYDIEPPNTQWARDLIVSIKRRDVTGSSFSFRVPDKGDKWEEKDRQLTRRVNRLSMIGDMGPVTYPAYTQTSAQVRSMLAAEGLDTPLLSAALIRAKHGLDLRDDDRDAINTAVHLLQSFLRNQRALATDTTDDARARDLLLRMRAEHASQAI